MLIDRMDVLFIPNLSLLKLSPGTLLDLSNLENYRKRGREAGITNYLGKSVCKLHYYNQLLYYFGDPNCLKSFLTSTDDEI